VGLCSGAYDAAKEADLERFEAAVQHQSSLRRERHEFYSKVEARFASMADTIQRMKRDYYREIDHLREQLSRKRHDPNFEPDSSVVFFGSNSYHLPSWMDIVEELDGMRMKRELLQQEGSDRVRTVPIHMLCAKCRGKFQSPDDMVTAQRQNCCDKEVQVGGPEDGLGECEDVAMQTDWVTVDEPLSGILSGESRSQLLHKRSSAMQSELDQPTDHQNKHVVQDDRFVHADIVGQDDSVHSSENRENAQGALASATKSSLPATPTTDAGQTSPGVHSAKSRKSRGEGSEVSDTCGINSEVLGEVTDHAKTHQNDTLVPTDAQDSLTHEDDSQSDCSRDSLSHSSSLLAGFLGEADVAFQSLEGELTAFDDDYTDGVDVHDSQDPEMSEEARRRLTAAMGSHGPSGKGGHRASNKGGDGAMDEEGHGASNKEGTGASKKNSKGGGVGTNQDAKGGDPASDEDVKSRGSEGRKGAKGGDSERSSMEERALIMQEKLEKVFSEDAKERRRRARSRSNGRARSSLPSHRIPKRKQLAAAMLARQMEAIQKHLQRLAFARLKGAGVVAPSEKCDSTPASNTSSPQSRPAPRMPVAQLGGALAAAGGHSHQFPVLGEAAQHSRGDSPSRAGIKRPKGYSLGGPDLSHAASATEFYDSPGFKSGGQKVRSRSATRLSPTALDADLAESPQTRRSNSPAFSTRRAPSPAFCNRLPKTPPWGQNPGQANISNYNMDGIGAMKAQSAKSFAAAMRQSGDGLVHIPAHNTSHRRPGSATGIEKVMIERGLPLLVKGVQGRRAP